MSEGRNRLLFHHRNFMDARHASRTSGSPSSHVTRRREKKMPEVQGQSVLVPSICCLSFTFRVMPQMVGENLCSDNGFCPEARFTGKTTARKIVPKLIWFDWLLLPIQKYKSLKAFVTVRHTQDLHTIHKGEKRETLFTLTGVTHWKSGNCVPEKKGKRKGSKRQEGPLIDDGWLRMLTRGYVHL